MHYQRRQVASDCNPEWAYIKVCRIIHPVFFPWILHCPNCHSRDIELSGWTGTGHREVHGLSSEECVIGVQLRCSDCGKRREAGESEERYCFSTTSSAFWEKVSLWDIPREWNFFFHYVLCLPDHVFQEACRTSSIAVRCRLSYLISLLSLACLRTRLQLPSTLNVCTLPCIYYLTLPFIYRTPSARVPSLSLGILTTLRSALEADSYHNETGAEEFLSATASRKGPKWV